MAGSSAPILLIRRPRREGIGNQAAGLSAKTSPEGQQTSCLSQKDDSLPPGEQKKDVVKPTPNTLSRDTLHQRDDFPKGTTELFTLVFLYLLLVRTTS